MASLIAKTAYEGHLPLSIGGVDVTEAPAVTITSIAPLKGQAEAVSERLHQAVGVALPGPNRTLNAADARAIWTGQGQAFVLGPQLDPIDGAALTDQSDAWAMCHVAGPDARSVLSRFTPLDLRPHVFLEGHAARTLFGHMSCVLWREDADRYGLMVFRSMAGTAAHELERGMRAVAARRLI